MKYNRSRSINDLKNISSFLKAEYLIIGIFITLIILLFLPNGLSKETKFVIIPKGAGTSAITSILKKENIIRSKLAFRIIAGIRGGSLKAGEYELARSMFPWTVVSVLKSGKAGTHAVMIPEGFTIRQIAKLFSAKGMAREQRILELCSDRDFINKTGLVVPGLEGYLFPSTYFITRGMTEEEILLMMTRNFLENWKKSGFEQVIKQKNKNLNDIIKLASMVEREAETDFERPLIAGVFVNRLQKNMKLESCATVVYAYGQQEVQKNHLYGKDLLINSPFNTYLHYGLPPGPICNPGLASIKAAVFPTESKMLFFVLKNDGSSSHYFSATKSEHDQAVKTSKEQQKQQEKAVKQKKENN